jgi:hypothetical protein
MIGTKSGTPSGERAACCGGAAVGSENACDPARGPRFEGPARAEALFSAVHDHAQASHDSCTNSATYSTFLKLVDKMFEGAFEVRGRAVFFERAAGSMGEGRRQATDDITERGFDEVRELTKKFPAPGIG